MMCEKIGNFVFFFQWVSYCNSKKMVALVAIDRFAKTTLGLYQYTDSVVHRQIKCIFIMHYVIKSICIEKKFMPPCIFTQK